MADKKDAWWKSFVAGNVGGIFGLSMAYPLDTVKVRLQTRTVGSSNAYTGMRHCIVSMLQKEGGMSFYRGLLWPAMGYGAINAVAFGSCNAGKKVFTDKTGISDIRAPICGGLFAGLTSSFVRAPIEQIKTVMQARNAPGSNAAPYRNSFHCARQVVKTEGIYNGLYRGLSPTIIREMCQYAIYYPAYDIAKRTAAGEDGDINKLAAHQLIICGAFAGVAQWIPTYWQDVVKSRIHNAPPGTYNGFIHCTKTLLKTEGFRVFWVGFNAAQVRAAPMHGFIFLGYDMTMRMLDAHD